MKHYLFLVLARQQETEESEEHEVQEEVTAAVVITPTPESSSDDDDDDDTNFEAEALIPTQEHRAKVETYMTHSTTTVTVTELMNRGHHAHHRKRPHIPHQQTQTIAPPEETETPIDESNQNETILDSLLAQYFPEEINISHLHNLTSKQETVNLPDERNKNPRKQQYAEPREQIQTATRKPKRQKKRKTTTQRIPTTKVPTSATTTETQPREELRGKNRVPQGRRK